MAPHRTLLVASVAAALAACDTPAGPNSGTVCNPDGQTGSVLSMSVGDVETVSSPADLACLRIQGSAEASRYLFVPANVTDRQDVRVSATFKASESEAASATQLAMSLGGVPLVGADRPARRSMSIDDRIRAFERTAEFRRGLENRRLRPTSRGARFSVSAAVAPTVGSTKTIRVPNFDDDTPTLCDNPISIITTVKAVGENSVILVDDNAPANGLSDADYTEIAAEFDTLIFPVDTTYFGVPSDLDVDERIYILYTPEVNKLSEPNSGSYVGGFFFSGDLFDAQDCAQSNETEIFYLLAADPGPNPLYGNKFEADFIRVSTRGTIAHEFQHMINIGVKIAAPFLAYDETAWLNEGLSHFAEELVGRRALNRGVLDELTWAQVYADRNTYIAFFYQNFARFEDYLLSPGSSSPTSEKAAEALSYRGAAWAFVRHLADHRSGGDVDAFTRALVLSPDTGIANTESRTGVSFEEQIRGWLIANAADDRGVPNLAPVYEYASWRLIDAMECFASDNPSVSCTSYPLKVTSLGSVPTTGSRLSILSGSGAYYLGAYSGSTPTITVQLIGNTGQQLTAEGARIFVLRMD
ncbi:MAG TPA: hypothetical protein VFZ11_12040 [Gemmatimonadaceae bacterium]